MTSNFLNLDIDASGIENLAFELAQTMPQIEKALASTLRKMAVWLSGVSIKGLSGALDIQQKILRRRLKTFRLRQNPQEKTITVWYGLNPIAYVYLGTPRQTATGVKVGKYDLPGAFVARGRGGKLQVFKRLGRPRTPIVRQELDIHDKAQTYIEDKILGAVAFESQFFKFFEHELKWQTRIKA